MQADAQVRRSTLEDHAPMAAVHRATHDVRVCPEAERVELARRDDVGQAGHGFVVPAAGTHARTPACKIASDNARAVARSSRVSGSAPIGAPSSV